MSEEAVLDVAGALGLPGASVGTAPADTVSTLAAPVPGSTDSLFWSKTDLGSAIRSEFAPTRLPFILGLVFVVGILLYRLSCLARALDAERLHARGLARQDTLTLLGNRLAFEEALAERSAGIEPFALACIDLDGFKAVNDRHGHPAGDAVLRGVAARLRIITGDGDLAFRLGGDEFALILSTKGRDLTRFARKIVFTLDDVYDVGGGTKADVGACLGLALASGGDCGPRALLLSADMALYRAKAAGRSNWRIWGGGAEAGPVPVRREAAA